MPRRLFPALLAVLAVLLAGCGSGAPPTVTFTVSGQERTTGPTQYCDLKLTDCSADANAEVHLPVPAGMPVHIAVPEELSSAPWHVVFSYHGPDDQKVDGRSPVFAPNTQRDYTLVLPDAADTLLTAQVQQFGPAPVANEQTGEIEFPVRGSWVLVAAQQPL
ncbi:DUF2771 family protein [Pseudonocardia asaccharolytica]|uniref:DUF2771 family protein n=1 Tax=Pseudonocardia asaccharolytica TaxID=54010 RepID=UPI00041E478A|nr:DUF2771 family protein [Pseudonocardia asaccharolytica]